MTFWIDMAVVGETLAYLWRQPSFLILCLVAMVIAVAFALRDTRR